MVKLQRVNSKELRTNVSCECSEESSRPTHLLNVSCSDSIGSCSLAIFQRPHGDLDGVLHRIGRAAKVAGLGLRPNNT